MIDAHCHLQDLKQYLPPTQALAHAANVDVTHAVCCGEGEHDWQEIADLANQQNSLYPSFGLHPWFVMQRSSSWEKTLEKKLLQFPHAGVGEIGLDNQMPNIPMHIQKEVFCEQLNLAIAYKRPVSIHCRQAFGPLLDIIEKYTQGNLQGLIHAWSGSPQLIPRFERLGFYISFGGSITHPTHSRARQSAQAVSLNHLLIESDAPALPLYGTPQPLFSEPANVKHICQEIALLRNTSFEEIADATTRNCKKLFGLAGG